ncbi:MAG: DUF4386 domain-containing protein [Chitinophagaceae bacterium]
MYSNKKLARIAGALYLVVIATGLFAEVFVRQRLSVPGDAVATAHNIRNADFLFRAGLVADLVNLVCGLPIVLIVYILFKPVNKYLAILAVFFVVVQTAAIAANLNNQVSTLLYLGGETYLSAFQPGQLAVLAKHGLSVQSHGYGIALIFFAFYCMIAGYLIYRSAIVPRVLGILYAIAGLAYLINTLTLFLLPKADLFIYFAIPAFLGELSLCMWWLVMGVKEQAQEQTIQRR